MTGRGLRGRRAAGRILAIVVGLDAVVAFLFITAPPSGPLYEAPPSVVGWLVPAVGVAVHVIGLAWMIRIYRSDPEAHPSFWRFRRS
jgi:hypothetical protein